MKQKKITDFVSGDLIIFELDTFDYSIWPHYTHRILDNRTILIGSILSVRYALNQVLIKVIECPEECICYDHNHKFHQVA